MHIGLGIILTGQTVSSGAVALRREPGGAVTVVSVTQGPPPRLERQSNGTVTVEAV